MWVAHLLCGRRCVSAAFDMSVADQDHEKQRTVDFHGSENDLAGRVVKRRRHGVLAVVEKHAKENALGCARDARLLEDGAHKRRSVVAHCVLACDKQRALSDQTHSN